MITLLWKAKRKVPSLRGRAQWCVRRQDVAIPPYEIQRVENRATIASSFFIRGSFAPAQDDVDGFCFEFKLWKAKPKVPVILSAAKNPPAMK